MPLTTNQKKKKNRCFEGLSFLILCNNKPSLSYDMRQAGDCIQQPATASSVAAPRSSKALPRAKLEPNKVMDQFGGLLLV